MKFKATDFLMQLISTQSFSQEEHNTAGLISSMITSNGFDVQQVGNNVYCEKMVSKDAPTLLLNSHHDTVKPSDGWKRSPFDPVVEHEKLYGLGSNDAGASLVALMHIFFEYEPSGFNLLFAASAEEEISGPFGMALLRNHLDVDFAIVGEPTKMQAATSEKGLMVVDATAHGKAGHAARDEGVNAIELAIEDIQRVHAYQFDRESKSLGPVKMTVTTINAGEQHNVVPDKCTFTIDIRSTDTYSNDEILEILKVNLQSTIAARSTRLQPSGLPNDHVLHQAIDLLGIPTYGSPTLSDQALMPWPSVKLGPGDSARSHTADEFILLEEIDQGIEGYRRLLKSIDQII